MAAEPLDLGTRFRGFEESTAGTPSEAGDFDALYREHFDRVRRFVLGLTGQEALAEDIAQETLLRAYTNLDRVDLSRPLWPWLKCVARRLVVDRARAAQRETLDPDPLVETGADELDATAARHLLWEAMGALPVRQRAALALRYLDDWKSAEVAAAMGLSRTAVEQLLLRARRSFSMEYLRLGGEPATSLRVAVWPLLALLAWVRDRAARVRQMIVESGGAPLSLAADGVSNVVVAVTVGGVLFAGGVALALPAPERAPAVAAVTAQSRGPHAEALRLPGRADARGVTLAAVDRAARPAAPAHRPATAAPAGTAKKVVVSTAPVAQQAPAAGVASTSRERQPDRLTVAGEDAEKIGDAVIKGKAGFESECGQGTVGTTACAVYDEAEKAGLP